MAPRKVLGRLAALVVATLALAACTTASGPRTAISQFDFPPPFQMTSAAVGERMAEFRSVKEVEGLRFTATYEPSAERAEHVQFRIRAGETFPLAAYAPPSRGTSGAETKIYAGFADDLARDGARRPATLGVIDGRLVVLHFLGEDEPLQTAEVPESMIEEVMVPVENETNRRRVLVYTGRVGSRLGLLYLEFVGDMATPKQSRELSFDLADGNVVVVEGARFEIIEANARQVRFRRLDGDAVPPPPAPESHTI